MKKLLNWSVGIFLKSVVLLFSWIPNNFIQRLSSLFAFLLEYIFAYRKRVIQENILKSSITTHTHNADQISSAYYHHLSDLFFETLKGFSASKRTLNQQFQYANPDIFQPFLDNGQSCILVGSHYNNWELGCLSFPLWVQAPVFTVYKPLSNGAIDAYINQLRSKWGMNMVAMRQLGRKIIEQKETPSLFIFVADQSPASLDHAVWVDFLKRPTPFIHGFEKIAKKTNYPVFYFSINKKKRGFYEVTFYLLDANPQILERDELTKQYAKLLEEEIQKSPSNWLWSHRRWKRVKEKMG